MSVVLILSVLTRADVKEACFARLKDAVLSPARIRQVSAYIERRTSQELKGGRMGWLELYAEKLLCNRKGRAALGACFLRTLLCYCSAA